MYNCQEKLLGILSGSQEVGANSDISSMEPPSSKHDTIMRKYSVKNTLYHKTSPVLVT